MLTVTAPEVGLTNEVIVFWKAADVSFDGALLAFTVKYTLPPVRSIGVTPSLCKKVRLTVREVPCFITIFVIV
jgi:hypothetical protein